MSQASSSETINLEEEPPADDTCTSQELSSNATTVGGVLLRRVSLQFSTLVYQFGAIIRVYWKGNRFLFLCWEWRKMTIKKHVRYRIEATLNTIVC